MDFYDASLVDGYNLPLVASPEECMESAMQLTVLWISTQVCNELLYCKTVTKTLSHDENNAGCPKELQPVQGDTSHDVK